jgi:hypothetical protein
MNRAMELAEQTQSRATTLPGTTQAGGEQFNKKTTRSKDFWHTATVRRLAQLAQESCEFQFS